MIWSHQIVPLENEIGRAAQQLIELGEDGWELVCIIQHPNPRTFMPGVDENTKFFAFFKKEIRPRRVG